MLSLLKVEDRQAEARKEHLDIIEKFTEGDAYVQRNA